VLDARQHSPSEEEAVRSDCEVLAVHVAVHGSGKRDAAGTRAMAVQCHAVGGWQSRKQKEDTAKQVRVQLMMSLRAQR
jgi:hypothetical protein